MAVTSTACAGAAAGEKEVAEAAGVVLVGVAAATVVLGGAAAAELGAAAGDEDLAEAAGTFGLVGVAAATVVVGEATAGNAARGCYGGVSEYFRHEFGEHSPRGEICATPGQKASQLSGSTSSLVRLAICTKARGVAIANSINQYQGRGV